MPWCRSSSCTWPTPVWNQRVEGTGIKFCTGVTSQTTRDQGGEWSVLASCAILVPALKPWVSVQHNAQFLLLIFTLALSHLCRWAWIPAIQSSISPLGTQSSNINLDKVMSKKTGGTQRRGMAALPVLYHTASSWLMLKGECSLCYLEHSCWIPPLQMESYVFLSSTQCTGLLCTGHMC